MTGAHGNSLEAWRGRRRRNAAKVIFEEEVSEEADEDRERGKCPVGCIYIRELYMKRTKTERGRRSHYFMKTKKDRKGSDCSPVGRLFNGDQGVKCRYLVIGVIVE